MNIKAALPEIKFDREQAFLLYATFTGDVARTAAVLGVRAIDVLRVADEEAWAEKLKPILDLQKSSRPGDIEKAINRALNFVQAHRMRMVVERVIQRLTGLSPEDFQQYIFTSIDIKGHRVNKLSARAIADLASALEKTHAMTYLALGDSAADRAKAKDVGPDISSVDMNARIAEAMAKASKSKAPRALLFDAQLEVAQSVPPEPKQPETVEKPDPYND